MSQDATAAQHNGEPGSVELEDGELGEIIEDTVVPGRDDSNVAVTLSAKDKKTQRPNEYQGSNFKKQFQPGGRGYYRNGPSQDPHSFTYRDDRKRGHPHTPHSFHGRMSNVPGVDYGWNPRYVCMFQIVVSNQKGRSQHFVQCLRGFWVV